MTTIEIADEVSNLIPDGARGHVTYSGGNPAIHKIDDLIERMRDRGVRQAIETQATVWNGWIERIDDLTLSPKPPSSGNQTPVGKDTVLHRMLSVEAAFVTRTLKVVVFDDEDYHYARQIHLKYPEVPMVLQVGTEVGESTRDSLLASVDELQQRVMKDPVMFDTVALPQMHVVLRGHARGI